MSTAYEDHLVELVENQEVPESVIDDAVSRILGVKLRMGLFAAPYRALGAESTSDRSGLAADSLDVARRLAVESAVLLKNEGGVLPLSPEVGRVAVVGPLADAPHEQLGTWAFDGRQIDSRTPLAAFRERLGEERVRYAAGLSHSRDTSEHGFAAALAAAQASEAVVFFGGEEAILSGEAHSRADLRLPGAQEALLGELAATGKPIVLVILAGRPLAIHDLLADLDAVVMAWHPGTLAGPALADLLFGDVSPSGRLPISWPKAVGQIPVHYNHKNTGRPPVAETLTAFEEIQVGAWQSSLANTSHYLDLGSEPEFPFGFGLTYSTFRYSDLAPSAESMTADGSIEIAVTIANTGARAASEVVQLYVRDLVASRTRPVRELKDFRKVTLEPGASERVRFRISAKQLEFHDGERWVLEPGRFEVWIAPDATSGLEAAFELR